MSTTASRCIPNSRGHHDSGNPSLTTSAPDADAISLTDLQSISGDSIHSSASAAQATPYTSSPTAQPAPGNAQAVAEQTWFQKTWKLVYKKLGSSCTACGLPQLLVGLVGLGLAIPLLKLSIYSYQLSQWTAWKDFRQDCKSLNNILTAVLFTSTTVALILIAASLSTFGSLFSSEFQLLETPDLHADTLSTTPISEGVESNVTSNANINSPLPIHSGMTTMRILGRLWRQQRFLRPSQDPSCLVFQEPDLKVGKSTGVEVRSDEKLKKVTGCLTSLRREIVLLNASIDNCEDENFIRTEVIEVFDSLLQILVGLIKFQHSYCLDQQVIEAWGSAHMYEWSHSLINSIGNTIRHIQQTSMNRKSNRDYIPKLQVSRQYAFYNRLNYVDYTEFPVQVLPKTRVETFYGRDAQIDEIDAYLGNQHLDRLRTFTIYGRRGVGKTQIALEFAYRHASKFEAIFWIRCETSASLRQSFAEIAVALELPGADIARHFEENRAKVLQWLKETEKTWLLIYDNAEEEQLVGGYWPVGATGSILLTSRHWTNIQHDEYRSGQTVPLFDQQERWDLLMKLLGLQWQNEYLDGPTGPLEREAGTRLMTHLGGLTLAIVQAATLIKETRFTGDQSIRTLLKIFETSSAKLPPRQVGARDNLIHALDAVWSIALNALSPNARSLLSVLSLLAPDSMPLALFLPVNQSRLDSKLEFCKRGTSEDSQLTLASAVDPSPALEEALGELQKANLVTRSGQDLVIHRVIQEAMNFHGIHDLQESFNAASKLVYEAFPKQDQGRPFFDVWPRCQLYIPHAVNLVKLYKLFRQGRETFTGSDEFVRLLCNCAWYLFEVSDYTVCLDVSHVGCSASASKRSEQYAHLLNTIGTIQYEKNNLQASRKAYDDALKIRLEIYGASHLETAIVLANLGNVESAEGNYEEAKDLFERAAVIREQCGGTEEFEMLGLTCMQLGRVAALQGEYEHAYKMYQKSEAYLVRKPGHSDAYLAHLTYAYGNLEYDKKAYKAALRLYDDCLSMCLRLWPMHHLTVSTYYKLACVEYALRHPERALLFLDKANNIAEARDPGEFTGGKARILRKKGEILSEDPIRGAEGQDLKSKMEEKHAEIAKELGLRIEAEDVTREEAFDLLVPGYFR